MRYAAGIGTIGGNLLLCGSAALPLRPGCAGPPEGELPEGQERPPWGAPSTEAVEGEAWVLPHQGFFCGNDKHFNIIKRRAAACGTPLSVF